MMGWSSRCYIQSFVEIGLPVPEKKIFMGFYHIWAWQPSWSCDQHHVIKFSFPYLYLKAFLKILVQIGTVVSGKIRFDFCMYTTLGQVQEMTLTFNTHTPSYIQLDVAPTNFQVTGCNSFFLKNPLFSLFPIEKPKLPNLTLP